MIDFFVEGIPQTKGSARAIRVKGKAYPVIINANAKNTKWERAVKREAALEMAGRGYRLFYGPISVAMTFFVKKPKRVKGTAVMSTTRPDCDKYIRSILDALTGICYRDDGEVSHIQAIKFYSDRPGVQITVKGVE